MNREEFESRITASKPTEEEFKIIEFVYNYHPSISDVDGKKQIADLYSAFGMRLIRDMLPTAKKAEALENEIRIAIARLKDLSEKYEDLKSGEEE